MKISRFLPLLIAALAITGPLTGFTKDKDRHRDRDHDRGDHHRHDRGHSRHYDRGDRHHHSSSHRSYGHRSHGYGSYGYGSSYYGYGRSHYGYSPYYYPRSNFGISFSSRPSYRSYSSTYRGRVASGYSDGLAADVQSELRRRGYYRGAIDGDIGPGSRHAISAYQRDRGLRATGRIDSSLLRALGIG